MKSLLKISLPIVYIGIWIAIYLGPRKMFHVGGQDGPDAWILGILFFAGLPILLYNTLKIYAVKKSTNQTISAASIYLIAPFILLIIEEDKSELESYKEFTTGIVIQSSYVKPRKGPKIWSIKAEYYVNSKRYYTSSKEDGDELFRKGDTVTIVHSTITPQMSEIKDLIDYYE